jgi:hypothetical protein
MPGISWLAENQLASQEGLCSVEQVTNYVHGDIKRKIATQAKKS